MKQRTSIAVCAIAKNESPYIKEWVEYYRNIVGVDKIFIYDNNRLRDDSLTDAIQKQIRSGFVTVIDYRGKIISRLSDQNGDTLQGMAYRDCYENNSKYYDWIGFFDIDEFLDVENKTLRNVLDDPKFEDTQVIHFQWKLYGDNGHIRYRDEPVLNRFKDERNASYSTYTKAMVRTGLSDLTFSAHGPLSSTIKHRLSSGNSMFNTYQTDIHKDLDMYLMHFFTKSTEEFFNRKYKKTSAVTGKNSPRNYNLDYLMSDNPDEWGYFKINEKTQEKLDFINEFVSDANSPKIVVGITSYKERLEFVPAVVRSLLNQYIKPYKIVLTLYKDDTNYIPDELAWYIEHGDVELITTEEDLGPHKKYFYAMKKYRDNPFVTVDDDIIYTPDMIQNLWNTHLIYSEAIVARRVHYITIKNNNVTPYSTWKNEYTCLCTPSYDLFATTGAGTLFPENILNVGDENLEDIKKCLYADDIYIKWLANKNNIKIVWSTNDRPMSYPIKNEKIQSTALFKENVVNGRNDEYMKEFNLLHSEMSGIVNNIVSGENSDNMVNTVSEIINNNCVPHTNNDNVAKFGPILRRRR